MFEMFILRATRWQRDASLFNFTTTLSPLICYLNRSLSTATSQHSSKTSRLTSSAS